MKKTTLLLGVLLMSSLMGFSQNLQNSQWINGGGSKGLHFENGNYFVANPPARELWGEGLFNGYATACDENGFVKLVTDGNIVWRNSGNGFVQMTDQLKAPHTFAAFTQSTIIVPKPLNPGVYYIVTISGYYLGIPYWLSSTGEDGFHQGAYFSEIDLNSNEITILNAPLLTPSGIGLDECFYNISNALTATLHADGINYWIVVHADDYATGSGLSELYSYLVTQNGIEQIPTSHYSIPHDIYNSDEFEMILSNGRRGSNLKISEPVSSNTRRIALSFTDIDENYRGGGLFCGLFDTNTGEFSLNPNYTNIVHSNYNQTELSGFLKANDQTESFVSVEFSTDSNILYALRKDGLIRKFDIADYGTALTIGTVSNSHYKFLQRGMDDKIYISTDTNTLYTIENPNSFFATNVTGFDFSGHTAMQQLIPIGCMSLTKPVFDDMALMGNGSASYELPAFSSNLGNQISGTWDSPLMEGEHTYTFMPDDRQCAAPVEMVFTLIRPGQLLAVDDNFQVNSPTAVVHTASIYDNDTIGDMTDVVTTMAPMNLPMPQQHSVNLGGASPVLNPDGTITIPAGFPDGTFTITYQIAKDGCTTNTSTATATVTVGTESYARKSKPTLTDTIPVYPNPSNSIFNIDLSNVKESYSSIKVYNLLGSVIYEGNLSKSLNQIDLSNVPTGYYFAHLSNGENNTTVKLIKN